MTLTWQNQLFARELTSLAKELRLFPDERSIWETVSGITNSVGTLSLHVCGNLQYYVGAVLGGTGYVRDRAVEFSSRNVARAVLVEEIHKTIKAVHTVLTALPESTLKGEYPIAVGGVRIPTGLFLLHLNSHLAHHLGQAGYLRRALTGENRGSGALPLAVLMDAPTNTL